MANEERANPKDSGVSLGATYAGPSAAAAVSDGEFELRSKTPARTGRCQQCHSDEGAIKDFITLDCNIHYYCKECFRTKTRRDGTTDMYVCRAKQCKSYFNLFVLQREPSQHGTVFKKVRTTTNCVAETRNPPRAIMAIIQNCEDGANCKYFHSTEDMKMEKATVKT